MKKNSNMKINELHQEWFAYKGKRIKPSSLSAYETAYATYIAPYFQGWDMQQGVEQLTADGHHITFYPSQIEAERQTGIHRSQIRACCQGKPRYQTAGGFRWRYKVITTDNGKS